jgi:hypothetical protein
MVMRQIMDQAMWIVRARREWFNREARQAPMHKFIIKAIDMCRPDDWQKLMLQWPHMADRAMDDYTKLAYTRDEKAGIADRQTVTSLGKYLRAHFSLLPDDAIRDIVALAQANQAKIKIVRTTAEMIYHLHKGPGSCMQWEDESGVKGEDGDRHHPYEAYAPELGWAMAVRIEGYDTVGRALVNEANDKKIFVRSYKKTEGYSPSDEQLEAWLTAEGYAHVHSWRNRYIKLMPTDEFDCGFIAPYIDGDDKGVDRDGGRLKIVSNGEYICNNTDGSADEQGEECACCGDRVRDGDGYWAGPWEEDQICSDCRDHSYVYARGRNRRQYLVHEDNAMYVESLDEQYHDEYLDDNNIVQLRNGDAEHLDNAVEVDGDYYHVDDERVVRCVDDDEYHLKRDVYHHEDSGEYYADEDNIPKDDVDEDDIPKDDDESESE